MSPSKDGGRTGSGRFARGNQLGKGRPEGSRTKATIALQALLDKSGEPIMEKAVELAKAGDKAALRLCMERLLPRRKDRAVSIDLPELETAADARDAAAAIARAVAQGEVSVAEAAELGRVIETFTRALEDSDLEARLQRIEVMLEGKR